MTRMLHAATLAACLALAGCATPVAPPPAPSGLGGYVVTLPSARQRLVFTALQEWQLWGRVRWDLAADHYAWPAAVAPQREHTPDFSSRVLLYWQVLHGGEFPAEEAQYRDGSLVAWSAVFISFLMKSAGIGEQRFAGSMLHWHYIKQIVDAPDPQGFEALDAATAAPAVGDLICAPRHETAQRVTRFAQLAEADSRGGYHCDLVVHTGPSRLGAIGGNVRDGVVWSEVPLDAAGRLQPTPQRPWLVVLRNHLP